MAEAALSFLLEELKEVLKWYKDLLSGSDDEFQKLNEELGHLKAFLRDADNKSAKPEVYKEMEREIREVVYDVEDQIDICLTKAAEAEEKKKKNSRVNIKFKLTSTRFRLADEVRSLREEKVKPVLKKVYACFPTNDSNTAASPAADQPPERPKKDRIIRRDKVVGFKDEEATLLRYLTEETSELDVISIIGMPGLGKTTLAMKIFENEDICYQFPIRIWVYVSQRFNSRDVFLNILRKFTTNDKSGLSDEELVQEVRDCLAKEKFLLVMDDVWSREDWNVIRSALPNNALGKVMITSRERSVGQHANPNRRNPHMLRFFTEDESWELLQLEVSGEVFRDVEDRHSQLIIMTGKSIAKQCDGVPLTVVVIGGVLRDLSMKHSSLNITDWEKVSQNVSELIEKDPEKRISEVVALSYNRLPDHLRDCFLYMAVFPEEHYIPAWMLTRLWIAEGFIRPTGTTLEEAAEENLADLVNRNLLMLHARNPMGEIKTCQVHDMIRVFCRERALEHNLFQEIKKNREGVFEPAVSNLPKFHRLCFNSDLTKFFGEKPNGRERIRSLLCFYKEPVNLDAKYISAIPDAFTVLRVLESISIKLHQFPAKVTKLSRLRYVTLHIANLTLLPEPLSSIYNLQTLVVETKSRSIAMKANIWKMYRLRHLKMKAAIVLDEKWDGKGGENLQTLSRLAPESCTPKLCEKARNLKELGIRGNLATLFGTMSMKNLDRLQKLKLMHDVYESENQIVGLPQHIDFPPKLMRLTLSNTYLDWKYVSTLAKIKTLEVLKLKNNAFTGTRWTVAAADVFDRLQILLIIEADFKDWEAFDNNFPILRYLVLKNCHNLKHIPGEAAGCLQTLTIDRLCKSAVDSAKTIEAKRKAEQENDMFKWEAPFKLHIGPGSEK